MKQICQSDLYGTRKYDFKKEITSSRFSLEFRMIEHGRMRLRQRDEEKEGPMTLGVIEEFPSIINQSLRQSR